jgi:hypothetical protein
MDASGHQIAGEYYGADEEDSSYEDSQTTNRNVCQGG